MNSKRSIEDFQLYTKYSIRHDEDLKVAMI